MDEEDKSQEEVKNTLEDEVEKFPKKGTVPFTGSRDVTKKVKGIEPPVTIPNKEKWCSKAVNVKSASKPGPVVKSVNVRAKGQGTFTLSFKSIFLYSKAN